MGLAGATAEDAEAEFIDKIVEKDIVTGRGCVCHSWAGGSRYR